MGLKLEPQETFRFSDETHSFEIQWRRVGDTSKQPLIFIHGTPWSSIEWHELAAVLQGHYCIYLYDHPGFESSPQAARHDGGDADLDPSLTLRAAASAALINSWSLSQRPHVVAHDNGGLVSLRLLLEHGIKFASLCLVDVVAIGPFGTPWFSLVANNLAILQQIPAKFQEGFVRAYIRSAAFKPLSAQTEDQLAQQWLEDGAQGPARFLQEMVQAHHRSTKPVEEQYSTVGEQIPVKVIWGAGDAWIPVESAHRLHKALNAQELVVVEEAGHLIQYDQPSRLAFEIGVWLSKQDKGKE